MKALMQNEDLLRSRSRHELLPGLDLGRVGALDIGEGGVVELFGQRFGEQDGEFGIVDELLSARSTHVLTGIPKSTAARREA